MDNLKVDVANRVDIIFTELQNTKEDEINIKNKVNFVKVKSISSQESFN